MSRWPSYQDMMMHTSSGHRSIIPYVQCECRWILLSPRSSSAPRNKVAMSRCCSSVLTTSSFVQRPWLPFISRRGGPTNYSLISMGNNFIMEDISVEPFESPAMNSGFNITVCPIPSILLMGHASE
jgi:hypothetical protein